MSSILGTIKDLLGGAAANSTDFDGEIMVHINTQFGVLYQLGVGPSQGYMITSADNEWSEFTSGNKLLEMVKSYIYMRVRLLFDPPQNSSVLTYFKDAADILESRIRDMVDKEGGFVE